MFDPSKKKKKKTKAKKDGAAGRGKFQSSRGLGDVCLRFSDEETGAGADAKPDAAAASAAAAVAPDAGAGSAAVAGGAASSGAAPAAVPVLGSVLLGGDGAEISYEDMLAAIFGLLHANNPDLTERCGSAGRRPSRLLVSPLRCRRLSRRSLAGLARS